MGQGLVIRIHKLTLATSDLRVEARFWGDTLQLPTRIAGRAVEVTLRDSLIRFEQAPRALDARYHFAINIPRGRIQDAAAWIRARHELLPFSDDPDVEEGATIVYTDRGAAALYFLDGGGNVVELIANDHLDNDLPQPFGPASFLEIAEIGLATTDTEATAHAVQQTFGADVLWGGKPGWQLTAIGDDHGVVIVAPGGRGWIPIGLRNPFRQPSSLEVRQSETPHFPKAPTDSGHYSAEAVTEDDPMSELPARPDVLAVGAGPVGLAVATALLERGRQVTVGVATTPQLIRPLRNLTLRLLALVPAFPRSLAEQLPAIGDR